MRVLALMYDDRTPRVYEVARDDSGALYSRKRGARKWSPVHPALNPDLDTYLARCESNFGWRIERVSVAS